MNKKKDPKTAYIIFRATPMEKQKLIEDAIEDGLDLSVYIRKILGLKND